MSIPTSLTSSPPPPLESSLRSPYRGIGAETPTVIEFVAHST